MSTDQLPADEQNDRRVERTRQALQGAFIALILERRYEDIRVADIVVRAGVGRSTFYEHFRGKEEVFERTFAGLLAILADAVCGRRDRLPFVVSHFWDNRRLARTAFGPPLNAAVRRWLAAMIAERAPPGSGREVVRMAAIQTAAAQISVLEAWLTGQLVASRVQMVDSLAGAAPLWYCGGVSPGK